MNKKKYLLIGTVVQILIIIIRCILGKSQKAWSKLTNVNKKNPLVWLAMIGTVVIGAIINIIVWPISIISEIYNTIKGI